VGILIALYFIDLAAESHVLVLELLKTLLLPPLIVSIETVLVIACIG